jgi:hypothetical protein
MHNYFIVISISNPDKSYDKNHMMSFLMSQTWFVYFILNPKESFYINVTGCHYMSKKTICLLF